MNELIKRLFSTRVFGAIGLAIAMVVLSACASTPPVAPTAELANARDAISTAEQDGARQHAGSQLDEAKQKLMRAEESVRNENMIQAERFAQQAAMAAELASARTESVKAEAINEEMGRSAEALDEEMRRRGGQQ